MRKWIAIFIGLAAAAGLMLTAAGAWIKSRQMSVAIIGGADGPTSIFVAGNQRRGVYGSRSHAGGGRATDRTVAGFDLPKEKEVKRYAS